MERMQHRVTLTDAQARLIHEWARDAPDCVVLPAGWPTGCDVVLPDEDALYAFRSICSDLVDPDALAELVAAAGDVSAADRARLMRVGAALARRLDASMEAPPRAGRVAGGRVANPAGLAL